MLKLKYGAILILALVWLTGCAVADLHLKPDYKAFGEPKNASGSIILVSPADATMQGGAGQIQWIIGDVKNSDGKVRGNVVTQTATVALVQDALKQELSRAGYNVQIAGLIPQGAEQALVLTAVKLHLDEISNLLKMESDCRVSFSIEIWKKGAKVNTLSYESRYSDFAIKDRDKLHQTVMQKALESALRRAVPELIKVISG